MDSMNNEKQPVLAVDVGGTKILSALVDGDNRIVGRDRVLSQAMEGPEAVLSRIEESAERVCGKSGYRVQDVHSISIAFAGILDINRGLVTAAPNLPDWDNVPLRDMIAERYAVDTFLINDASAAALAEHRLGAGRGVKTMLYLTVSTGIGGGIIINNELFLGASGCAGELGHITVDPDGPACNCGSTGCLEMLASGTAMALDARNRIKKGEKSMLTEMVPDSEAITAIHIADAAEKGDALARDVIGQASFYLGVGLAGLVDAFNPELVVIGGGVSKIGEPLLGPARQVMKQRAFPLPGSVVRVVTAELGDDVGVLGAALYAREKKTH